MKAEDFLAGPVATPEPTPVTFYSIGKSAGGADETEDKWTNRGYSSKGPNLTPGVVAVNDRVYPLGTILKDADSGQVFLATDRHGNKDANVVDVYVPPGNYKAAKVQRRFEVVGKVDDIPDSAEGVRTLLANYGTVPDGESAAESLARISGGTAAAANEDRVDVPELDAEKGPNALAFLGEDPAPVNQNALSFLEADAKPGAVKDGWNAFWGGIADSALTIPQGIYRQATELLQKIPDQLFLGDKEKAEWEKLYGERSRVTRELEFLAEGGKGDPELEAKLADVNSRIAGLKTAAKQGKDASPVAAVAQEYTQLADQFDEIRKDYARVYEVSPEFQNRFVGKLIAGAGQMVPQTAAAVLPGVGLTALQSQAFQYSWDDAKQTAEKRGESFDPEKAFAFAMANSFQQALLEKAGVDAALGTWMKKGGERTLKEFAKRIAAGAAGEGATEAAQGAVGDVVATVTDVEKRDPLNLPRRAEEFAIGGILGGGLSTVHAAGERLMPKPGAQDVQASGPVTERIDLRQLEGANSQEQFENLQRAAGVPVKAEDSLEAEAAPGADERFAPQDPPAPEPATETVIEDPFAIDDDGPVSAESYLEGGDADAEAAALAASEERARERMAVEAEIAEAMQALREESGSEELLTAVEALGGLPGRGSEYEATYRGELDMVRESAKANKRMSLFRKNAPDLDRLVTSLRDRGFDIEGPNQLFDLLDGRFRQGREVWSEPQRQDDYWAERQGMVMEDAAPRPAVTMFQPSPEAKTAWHAGLDALVNRSGPPKPVSFPETPGVLQAIGLRSLPMSMRPETVAKVTGRHQLTIGQLKQLPRELSDPLAVFASDNENFPESLVVLTKMMERDQPVIVAIHPNRREQNHTVHVIASAYGKTGWGPVFDEWIKRDRLLYVNTAKGNPWLRSATVQSRLEANKGGRKVLTQDDLVNPGRVEESAAFSPAETAARGDDAAKALGTAPVTQVTRVLGDQQDEFAEQEKLIALGWRREMLRKGKVDFVGREIRSAYDLAQAAQVYRDPRFETVRWLFTRGGKVVDTLGITSRNPRFSMALLPGHGVAEMVALAKRTGADGIWLLHNHPSGDPQPGEMDLKLTAAIGRGARAGGVAFNGHVVIDGGKFAVIEGDGRWELRTMPGQDELLKPEWEYELLKLPVRSIAQAQAAAEVFARVAADQRNGNGQVTLFLLDAKKTIRAVTTVPAELFLDRAKLPKYLHSRGPMYGVSFAVAFYDAPANRELVADAMAEYVRGSVLEDGLLSPREAVLADRGPEATLPGDRYFGEPLARVARAEAVMEDAAAVEETGGRLADEALKDGPLRVVSADGKNHYASVTLAGLPDIRIIEMPEMVGLARALTGSDPQLRRMRSALGKMVPTGDGQTVLDPRIFADSTVAAKVLAHEIGHLVDWLPDKTLKRGNLIGRLYSLRKHLSATAFGSVTGTSNAKVKEELLAVTRYWKPWDEATAPKWYTAYRKSSIELYADAISVLFNSPATLKEKAPTFYREFFAWLDKKPDVKREFFELQAFLHKPYMEVLRSRATGVQAMFGKAEEIFIRARERRRQQHMTARGWVDVLREQLYDRYDPIVRRQKEAEAAGREIPEKLRMDVLFDEHPLADNLTYTWLKRMWERVVKPLEAAEMTLEDMGEYLFFSRIMADRQGMANPKGHTPATARAALLRMRLDLGNKKFTLLERGAEAFHGYVFDTVREAAAAGIISQETFQTVIEPNRGTYAAFRPIDYVENYVPAGVYSQVGTLKEIENPWLTTILKTIAMRRAIQHQRAKVGTVEFLQGYFPGEIQPATTRFDGKRQVPQKPKDREKGLLEVREDGAWKGYEVPADVARMFETVDPAQASAVLRALNWVFKRGFYNIWVRFNPVFQLAYSPIRDAQRFYTNMPKVGAAKMAANYLKSMPLAVRRLIGKEDPIVTEMYETLALATPHDSFARNASRDDAFEEILRQFHIVPEPEQGAWRKNAVVKPALGLLRGIEFAGQIFEASPKIAAYKMLTRDLGWNVRDASYYVRNYVGVPNYLRKGRHATAAGSLLPFWNVAIQGLASDTALATGKERNKSAASWWFRWALVGGGYALLQAMARVGLLGDEAEDWFAGVSEYDFANFMVIPVGVIPGGDHGRKVVYLRVPQDEMHRLTNGLMKKFIEVMARQVKGEASRPVMNDLMELAGFSGGQLPGVNPALSIGAKWKDYMDGLNPWDSFRGKHVLSNAQYLAGGWESVKPMLTMTWNDAGLGNFYRFNPEADTTTELVLGNLPLAQRLVKVSDRGYAERQQGEIQLEQAQDARLKLAMPAKARTLATEHNFLRSLGKENRTPEQQARYDQLRVWYRTIYTPFYEGAQASADAGLPVSFSGLQQASEGWE